MDSDAEAIDRQLDRMAAKVRTVRPHNNYDPVGHGSSAAARCAESAILNEHTISPDETVADYLIPRKSLTNRLMLRLFKPLMEFADISPVLALSQASRDELADIAKQLKRCHPDNRAAYHRLLMSKVTLVYDEVKATRQLVWKSDNTLLNQVRPDQLKTVAVTRQTSRTKERIFEQESDDLPTWDRSTPRTWDDEANGR